MGSSVERRTTRSARLDWTRATPGRRVRCWLCNLSKSAGSRQAGDAHEIVRLAGHEVALHDLGDALDRFLESLEVLLVLAMQCDVDEDIGREADLLGVQEGHVAMDQPCFLQCTDAAQRGRLRQVDALRKLDVRQPSVALEFTQDEAVYTVHDAINLLRRV
ncbi:MAG: hypothetical protein AMJ58_01745 [Gammaproteobacteria bacterium SG8_30]|nr:MAG: hypothetical protein AMJ58_01745 [Gammaproteobacteria bacterium SG8_30]